jgi:sulfonate transport system substrate-binding protein
VHEVTLITCSHEGLAALTRDTSTRGTSGRRSSSGPEVQKNAKALVTGPGTAARTRSRSRPAALADPAKAAAIKDYLALVAQAHAWATNHQSAWAAVWAKASGLPDAVMVKAASDDFSLAVPITPAVITSEQRSPTRSPRRG